MLSRSSGRPGIPPTPRAQRTPGRLRDVAGGLAGSVYVRRGTRSRRSSTFGGLLPGALLAALALAACGGAGASLRPPAGEVVAFVDVNVVPMDRDTVLRAQTVLVRGGTVERIGPGLSIPAGATVVEGSGRYLIPGLTEMHAHIPPAQAGEAVIERTLFLYLSAGVTTIRGMLGDPIHLELRRRAEAGDILSPRIYTSGPSLNGQSAPTPAAARTLVESQAAAGYDLLKLHPGLSAEVFDTIEAAAGRVGIDFAGHVSVDVGVERALRARKATIDHLDGYVEFLAAGRAPAGALPGFFGSNLIDHVDESRIPGIVERTRAAGVANVPTQTLLVSFAGQETPAAMAAWPEMRYMPAATVAQWQSTIEGFRAAPDFTPERGRRFLELRNRLIRDLHAAGAEILLGSDAPQIFNVPGFSTVRELELMVEAGLRPFDALATGTAAPARHFDAAGAWGTITPGASADFVLLEGDPLADIGNVERRAGVMVRGRWLPQEAIQERLDAIAAELGR